MTTRTALVGLGNALVDVLAHVEDTFLGENGVEKGIMTLIDTDRAEELYGRMGPAREISGGSAANTIAGFAALGGSCAYIGKVRDDQLGAIFAHDMRAQGAGFDTPMGGAGTTPTGRCFVLVSPDGERSMNTYLGISAELGPQDVDEALCARADWLYLEGYRFDGPDSKAAFAKAIRATKAGGGRVAVTLSDPFCVDRHHADFRRLIAEDIDLLFANEAEVTALYQTDDFDAAAASARKDVAMAALTRGARGAVMVAGEETVAVPAVPTQIVDATGAGDLFAAGFFHGLRTGADLRACGMAGCIAATEIIGHIGARPEADIRALLAAEGL